MSILAKLLPERRTANLAITDEVLAPLSERRLMSTWSGVPVTWTTALRHIAVWSSTNFIADLISTLPWHTYRETAAQPVKDPVGNPLITDPDPGWVTPIGWRRQALVSLLMRGNAFGLILARDGAWPSQIRMTHPDDWSVTRRGKLEQPRWRYDNNDVTPVEMWRVTGYETPGSPIGMSPISYIAQNIGLGLAAQRFGAQWFDEGAVPGSVLINEQKIDEPIAKEAKRRWMEAGNSREPRTLGNGWKYQQISVAADESQFLETIQANGAMIATMFGLRPEDIGFSVSGASVTYSNVEQQQIARLVYPVHGWVRRLEDALSSAMPRPQYARANVDALLRVDLATRYKAHDSAIRGGWKNRNEVRELEELAPIEGGEEHLWPPYATSLTGKEPDA